MPTYNCSICSISTTLRANHIRHLKTKKHLKKTKQVFFLKKGKNHNSQEKLGFVLRCFKTNCLLS